MKTPSVLLILWMAISCSPYKRDVTKFTDFEDKDPLEKMLWYASLAGSSHNVQPWKVTVFRPDSVQICLDSDRVLPAIDPHRREVYISLGAFIENMVQAADAFGYDTELTYETSSDTDVVIDITLKQNRRPHPEKAEAIRLRRTLRMPFDRSDIKKSDLKKLRSLGEGHVDFFSLKTAIGSYISTQSLVAYTQQTNRKETQHELARWTRFSDKDVKKKMDGLTTVGLGIEGLNGWIVSHFMKPEDINSKKFVQKGIENTAAQVKNCAGWLLIFPDARTNETESWITAGRIYERLNIACREMKIGFHPISQLLEEEPFASNIQKDNRLKQQPLMLIRIGYVNDYPEPVSVRRAVEDFTTFK